MPTVDTGTGLLTLTGFAPVLGVQRQYLVQRLVVPGVGSSFVVGDPDPLPDTDFYITSKRRVHHPWIAEAGDGPDARPDISVGGQRLDLPLGRTVDAEVVIRVIDEPAPIATITCGAPVLIDFGNAGLDQNYLTSGGWTKDWDYVASGSPTGPHNWWTATALEPLFGGSALFSWADGGVGPWVRSSWIYKTFDGTEGGGMAWTPGQQVGVHFRVTWSLDTGPGNLFCEVTGQDTRRVSFPNGSFDWETMDQDLAPGTIFDGYLYVQADSNGEVLVKLGGENYAPSCNCSATFQDLSFVTCSDVITDVESERYVTSWLADADARQQLLGRAAYLEESLDGGLTWTSVLYAGYLKQIDLPASLTYVLTLGDAGRGQRVSKAWRSISPLATITEQIP